MYWSVLEYTGVYLECTGVYLECTGVYWSVLEFSVVYQRLRLVLFRLVTIQVLLASFNCVEDACFHVNVSLSVQLIFLDKLRDGRLLSFLCLLVLPYEAWGLELAYVRVEY